MACNKLPNGELKGSIGMCNIGTASFPGVVSIDNTGVDTMRVNWTNVSNAVRYFIYDMRSGSPVYVNDLAAPVSSYQISGLTPNTTYKYRVRLMDNIGGTDCNKSDKSGTTSSITVTWQGWSNVKALGPKNPAGVATGMASAVASVTLTWNAVTYSAGTLSSYSIFRSTSPGGEDYNSPLATGIASGARTYTDSTVVAGNTYYYVVRPVINSALLVHGQSDGEIKVIVPQDNMVLVHRWMANQEVCTLMNKTPDRNNNYRCSYTGSGNTGGFYDQTKSYFVDTVETGCNYTAGPACTGSGCIDVTGVPGAGVGVNGNVFYDRSTGNCYYKKAGAWTNANSATLTNAERLATVSNKPGLPPLAYVDQNRSWDSCQVQSVAGFAGNKSLLTRKLQIAASAWDASINDATIATIENGTALPTSLNCNANFANAVTFDNLQIPADIESVPHTLATGYKGLRTGSNYTTNCVSRYGAQDMVGNYWEWVSDQLGTCNAVAHTCTGQTSALDVTNTDFNGLPFDGTAFPGGGAGNVTEWDFSAMTFSATQFLVPLGLPMVTTAPAIYESMAIGVGAGQFDPAKFHGDHFWLYTDNPNGVPARGALVGGSWYYGALDGRFVLNLSRTPSFTRQDVGLRCSLPAE